MNYFKEQTQHRKLPFN